MWFMVYSSWSQWVYVENYVQISLTLFPIGNNSGIADTVHQLSIYVPDTCLCEQIDTPP